MRESIITIQGKIKNKGTWAPVYGMSVVRELHHSEDAFTQGLVCAGGSLWESTGLVGASRVRKLSMRDDASGGQVVAEAANLGREFGEGLARWDRDGTRLIQLTWRDEKANIWSAPSDTTTTPKLVASFHFPGERWGIAADEVARLFYVSDGTPYVKVYEKNASGDGLQLVREFKVTDGDGVVAIHLVNELELVEGVLWANIWMSPLIARINPQNGYVESWISTHPLTPGKYASPGHQIDVLNGIAYDPLYKRIFVTGKFWPRLFEIRVESNNIYMQNILRANPFFIDEQKVRQIWRSTGKNV